MPSAAINIWFICSLIEQPISLWIYVQCTYCHQPDPRPKILELSSRITTCKLLPLYYIILKMPPEWVLGLRSYLNYAAERRTVKEHWQNQAETPMQKNQNIWTMWGRVLIELLRMHCTVHVADWTCPKEPRGGLEQYAGACVGRRCLKTGFNSWSQFPVHTSAPGPADIQNYYWYY